MIKEKNSKWNSYVLDQYHKKKNDYLEHHGILGQKWGIRRFQNPDGTLTSAGKKRYSKEYRKESDLFLQDQQANEARITADAWNKAADEWNNGKLEEFGKTHTYNNDDERDEKYSKLFSEDFARNYNQMMFEFMNNNEHFKKAQQIAETYNLYSYDELAIGNKKVVEDFKRVLGE